MVRLKVSFGPGVGDQLGFFITLVLIVLLFGQVVLTPVLEFLLGAVIGFAGVSVAVLRGGLWLSKKGFWGLNQVKNWIFVYSTVGYGALVLLGFEVPFLMESVIVLFTVSVLRVILGGKK